jgi:hypothetical protein
MAFSESFMRELRQELDRLEGERRDLDTRINTLRRLLSTAEQPSLLPTVTPAQPRAAPETFKECVIAVLREHSGLRTPDITKTLRERGWVPGGGTDLGHRVYNELWRMRNRNQVRNTHDGGWELVA